MRVVSVFALFAFGLTAPVADPSFLGDIAKASYPTMKLAVDNAVRTTIQETSDAIEQDMQDIVNNKIPNWVPGAIRKKLVDFVRNQVIDRVSDTAVKTINAKMIPRLDALLDVTQSKVLELDVQVDKKIDEVHDAIRNKLGLPATP